jgi:hypothetical protein
LSRIDRQSAGSDRIATIRPAFPPWIQLINPKSANGDTTESPRSGSPFRLDRLVEEDESFVSALLAIRSRRADSAAEEREAGWKGRPIYRGFYRRNPKTGARTF